MSGVVACVGAGRMGQGMAHVFAASGHEVRLLDAKPRAPEDYRRFEAEALSGIRGTLTTMAELGALDPGAVGAAMERIATFPVAEAAVALDGVGTVLEGVPETREAKAAALALIDAHAPGGATVASTTSTFLSTDLSAMTSRPARFLNAHWLNPAFVVPLVELSPTPATDPAVTAALHALLERVGKVPVTCAASPGYIVPRIQALAMNEAARLVQEGVASAEDIDKAVRYGFGFRFAVLGLLEFIDWGGGDILFHASRYLADATGEDRFEAPEIVRSNMKDGRNGLRDGRGFYDYRDRDVEAYRRERLAAFLALLDLTMRNGPGRNTDGGIKE